MRLIEELRRAGREVIVYEPEIHADTLMGVNLAYLRRVLPDYRKRLVDWPTMCALASVILVTRTGVVRPEEIAKIRTPVIDLDMLAMAPAGTDGTTAL